MTADGPREQIPTLHRSRPPHVCRQDPAPNAWTRWCADALLEHAIARLVVLFQQTGRGW